MDITFSAEDQQFRAEVRDWLQQHKPTDKSPPMSDLAARRDFDIAWHKILAGAGWAGIAWPEQYGGRGLSLSKQLIWYEEYASAGMPPAGVESVCFVGLAHAGPTLIYSGSEAQKQYHLPQIINGDAIWCQGFSEPGAGSDLGSLRTRAVIDGDHLVVNGQKVWTSYAQIAQYQELLVRTDADAPKHQGITWVICAMDTPGITVRPIKNMSGSAEFCEVFYDDVRIPLSNVVGGINNGWRTAMSTLSFERGTAFIAEQVDLEVKITEFIDVARRRTLRSGGLAFARDDIAARLYTLKAETQAIKAMTYHSVSKNMQQDLPGPEGSLIRLAFSKLIQRFYQTVMDVLESDGLVMDGPAGELIKNYLFNYASTIGAGTEHIQRSIVSERLLGLPKSR
jgi:alkylation response protein AidB-like acyl-CoA dehydrogenase